MEKLFLKNNIQCLWALAMLTIPLVSIGQDGIFKLWPDSTLSKANSARNVVFMSQQEKQSVFYTNLARLNPPLFAETFLKDYLKENDVKKDKDVRELISALEDSPRMNHLEPNKKLTDFARAHAQDMGKSGRTGHNSSNGTTFKERLAPLEAGFDAVNENCNYGNEKGVDAVIDLLIDRKVPNAGHRKNILDPEMTHIGVAIEPHNRWRFNMVQDFGAKN